MTKRTVRFLLAIACLAAGCVDAPVEKLQRKDTVEISMDGLTRYNLIPFQGGEQAKTFQLKVNYPWSITYNCDWISVSPVSGDAGKEYTITISALANPDRFVRETSVTLSVDKDGWTKEYTLAQRGPEGQDSHPDGFSFFSEDFSWIPGIWKGNLKYGIPIINNAEETNSPLISALANASDSLSLNWSTFDASKLSARYEGYLMAGDGAGKWSISTGTMGGVDSEAAACVELSFDAAVYCDATGLKDAGVFSVSVSSGEGTILSTGPSATVSEDRKTVTFDFSGLNAFTWYTCQVILDGVTNDTQLAFSSSDAGGRLLLDNINVVRCSENAAVTDPAPAQRSDEYDFELSVGAIADGVENTYPLRVRAEDAWTLTSDSDWITIEKIADSMDNTVQSSVADNKLSASSLSSGSDYSGCLIALSTNIADERIGHLTLSLNGVPVKTITVTQAKAIPANGPIAKWTFTGLFCKKFLNVEPDPSTGGYAIASSWQKNQYADSDIVPGGRLSGYTKSASSFTCAATNRACNMLRFDGGSKGDYFLFSVGLVLVEAGSTISFRNASIAGTSVAASPADWVEEYSLDGENWTHLKDFHLTTGHYTIGKEDASRSMDCDIPITSTIVRGTLYVRMRISSNNTATSTFTDGGADICYIYSDPFITMESENSKTATYTGERDYLVFSVSK